jgi:hypothetical protein
MQFKFLIGGVAVQMDDVILTLWRLTATIVAVPHR